MQKRKYFVINACYSVTKYYLCKQNNKRSLLGRKQRHQVVRSFPNRYLFSLTNKVTCLFPISCILEIILPCVLPLSALFFMVLKGFVYTIAVDIYAFRLAFSGKNYCILHHFTLHLAPKRTAFSGILHCV